MEQRRFGDSELVCSALGFGTWELGTTQYGEIDVEEASRAIRLDLERGAQADVVAAYDTYTTARAVLDLDRDAVLVAQENYRVQDTRYRAGASTILDLLEAQNRLTQAEADVVRAQYAARLAVAGLEAILGQRLLTDKAQP